MSGLTASQLVGTVTATINRRWLLTERAGARRHNDSLALGYCWC